MPLSPVAGVAVLLPLTPVDPPSVVAPRSVVGCAVSGFLEGFADAAVLAIVSMVSTAIPAKSALPQRLRFDIFVMKFSGLFGP